MRATVTPHIEGSRYRLVHRGTGLTGGSRTRWCGDRLLHPAPDGAGIVVRTATFDGPVEISVETFHPGSEVPAAAGTWDLDEQLTLTATGHDVLVVTTFGVVEDLPVLPVAPGQRYGVRIYARGIEAAREVHQIEIDEEPVEEHLLQLFRAR